MALTALFSLVFAAVAPVSADLLVVGDNEAACAAAVQAVRSGVSNVVLVADCQMLGGQYSAQGVGPVDERVYVSGANLDFPRSGMALEIINAMGDYNLKRYGKAWPGNCWSATRTIEPQPAARIFDRLIAECGAALSVWRGYRPEAVLKDGDRVTGVRFGRGLEVHAPLTIDATDWGDVIRLGGVRHYSGVDPKSRFGEESAPETIDEIARQEMNPITWTLTLVERPDATPIPKPPHYDKANYPVGPIWRDDGVFKVAYQSGINATPYTQRRLVDSRHFKLKNVTGDVIQLNATAMDYPLCQWPARIVDALEKVEPGSSKRNFAELSDKAKRVVYADAKERSLGYLYFLQNDNPSSVERMRKFHLTDEFGTPDRLPPKPYIREGLRLAAMKMLTANEVAVKKGARPVWAACPDDAAFGFQFHLDFHPTRRQFVDAAGKPDVWRPVHSGVRDWRASANRSFFPYAGFVPETTEGLLGAGKNVGVSSLVQSALRLHPQMVLSGQCAGALAALSLSTGRTPREVVANPELVRRLQESTVQTPDGHPGVAIWARHGVEPGDPGFVGVNIPVVRPYPAKHPSGFKYNPSDSLVGRAEYGLPTVETRQAPVSIVTNAHGRVFVDFGKDAFGWLELVPPAGFAGGAYQLALGEARHRDETVDTWAGGEIRSFVTDAPIRLLPGQSVHRVRTTANARNTSYGNAVPPVRLRDEVGIVMPFRYVEFFELPFEMTPERIRRVMVHYPIDMGESSFACSDERLTTVYDFCKYSILATSFAGLYVDGDRERVPYEADAYLNQLGHYAISADGRLARATHEYLLRHPTWPTEWKQHSIMMAWADWMWTGETASLAKCYGVLRREKLFLDAARPDGLIVSRPERVTGRSEGDLVDWPPRDRDGFVFRPVNAVINAFHYRNLNEMAQMAGALGKTEDAREFARRAERLKVAYRQVFRDARDGLYRDGEGTDHKGFHANVAALAFGLVPEDECRALADHLAKMGMRGSVYFAQYYLEALYEGGRADAALALMTSDSDRSWLNMMKQGATIAMEAWYLNDKPNLDWNHAWGTPPLNIIARYVLGVAPREPGFARISVKPQPGGLRQLRGTVPTVRGPVRVEIDGERLEVTVPAPAKVTWRGRSKDVPAGRHVFGEK